MRGERLHEAGKSCLLQREVEHNFGRDLGSNMSKSRILVPVLLRNCHSSVYLSPRPYRDIAP